MALSEITYLDRIFLIADIVILALLALKYYYEGNSFKNCRKVEISQSQLDTWRFFLYGTIISTWTASLLLFAFSSPVRHILHLFFLIGVNYMMGVSIPAFVCKIKGFGGTCNCDFYEYNDFKPMIALGIAGNVLFIFIDTTTLSYFLTYIGLIVVALIVDKLIPKRELKPLKYPPEMLISEIDQLQAYLMTNREQKKLLTILDAKCDFCEIQVEELMRVYENNKNHLRIFDLTYSAEMDPIIPMTLNLNIETKIPVPTTFIFDSGMVIEQKDGVLSKSEIEAILMG